MAYTITRQDWEKPETVLLSKGRIGNARVYRVDTPDGAFVIKDFRKSPWWIRWTWGRWMISHEYALMKRLEGIPGIPQKLFKVDTYAFGMEFLQGTTLGDINQSNVIVYKKYEEDKNVDEYKHELRVLPATYFRKLERLIARIHRRGVTHLDTRNAKNILVLLGDNPGLIDFQSGVSLSRLLPKFIKRTLRLSDLSSVYKHYFRFYHGILGAIYTGPDAFPDNRARIFLAHLRLRKLWMFRGYAFLKKHRQKSFEALVVQHYSPKTKKEGK